MQWPFLDVFWRDVFLSSDFLHETRTNENAKTQRKFRVFYVQDVKYKYTGHWCAKW